MFDFDGFMARRPRFIWIVFAAVLLASVGTRLAVRWAGLETTPIRQWTIAATNQHAPVLAMGSSFAFFGIDFTQVARQQHSPVICRSAASASPAELEQLIPAGLDPQLTMIAVSYYDLNEQILGDFRADIVPLRQSVSDLVQSHADWPFIKKLLGQYPLSFLRHIFPSAGRSTAVMSGLRDRAVLLLKKLKGEPAPTQLAVDIHYQTRHPERLSDFAPSRLVSNLAALRVSCNGKHEFFGPKQLAFKRMLGKCKGKVLVVVLPVSPPYWKEFISPAVQKNFEDSLAEVAQAAPQVAWLRLDTLPQFQNSHVFWDLGHMNDAGQALATPLVLQKLKEMP
jgi:hypothetical protein